MQKTGVTAYLGGFWVIRLQKNVSRKNFPVWLLHNLNNGFSNLTWSLQQA